jgi:hypothetical protein
LKREGRERETLMLIIPQTPALARIEATDECIEDLIIRLYYIILCCFSLKKIKLTGDRMLDGRRKKQETAFTSQSNSSKGLASPWSRFKPESCKSTFLRLFFKNTFG